MKVIGIVGTRRRDGVDDFELVWNEFVKWYEPGDIICSGLCPKGGDRFAVNIADRLRLPKDKRMWFPAKWDDLEVPSARVRRNKWGKLYNANAGFMRNTDVAKNSDVLIPCVAPDRTGGTEDTVKKWKAFHEDHSKLRIV